MRSAYMEIDLSAFEYNIKVIKEYLKKDIKLMPVIKASAYGTHINTQIHILKEFSIVAVAIAEEGKELRDFGFEGEILILNQPDILDLETIIENNLTIGLSSEEFLEEVINKSYKIKVHLEIETGMGRTGITLEKLEEYVLKMKKANNIEITGVYTHFSSADEDLAYTNLQIEKFNLGVKIVRKYFKNIKYIHTSASSGILNVNNENVNTVRPGIIMYGYQVFEGSKEKIKLKPVAKLKAKINFIKTVQSGESISYGRKFITSKSTKIATIPLGYADGISRVLSNKGQIVIKGKKVNILGTICMDSFMVDITEIENVKVGDEVYIWDNENITLEEIAKKTNTINYEIISRISSRVPRIFVK